MAWPDSVNGDAKGVFRSTRHLRGKAKMQVRSRSGFGYYVCCGGLMAHGDNLSIATAPLIRTLDSEVETVLSRDGKRLA